MRASSRLIVLGLGGVLLGACQDPSGPVEPEWAEDPVQPAGRRVVDVLSAYLTTCALADSGQLHCWGENRFGEFGDGTTVPSEAPVLSAGGATWKRLFGSTGTPQMCGIDADDVAFCWGYNLNGELGDGTREDRRSPTRIAGDHRFRVIATSYHTCGVTYTGQVLCWGSALGGQLGNGRDGVEQLVPGPIASTHTYATVTSGMQFSCALRTSGEADCWGWGVGLGSGPGDRSVPAPTPVSGGRRYTRISAGPEWVCALDVSGAPFCWGKSGPWPGDFRPGPEAVSTRLRFEELVSGEAYGACALDAAGAAYCWAGRRAVLEVPGRHRFVGIGRGQQGYCGYTPGGSALCWKWRVRQVNGEEQWDLTLPEWVQAVPS